MHWALLFHARITHLFTYLIVGLLWAVRFQIGDKHPGFLYSAGYEYVKVQRVCTM